MDVIGQQIGNYLVTGLLGRGGMGAVYAGQHTMMGNKVAIKVLLPEYSHKKQLVQRFFTEARAATRIEHPGIVKVYDFGEHQDGSNYIIMEFLPGEPLSDRLGRTGRIPVTLGVRLLQQCASALEAAHRAGIVHRDLKPDNIFLCPDPDITGGERVKLLDFGVAKLVGDLSMGDSQTRTGTLVGTPRYMAPEQCAGGGRVIDHRADLYALGCVGFAILCGRPPFLHDGLGELLAAHMFQEPPSAMSLEPSLPVGVDSLLMCLLAKDPAQRYQSAAEVTRALEAAGQGLLHGHRPSGPIVLQSAVRASGSWAGGDPRPVPTTLSGASVSVVSMGDIPRPRRTRLWPLMAGALVVATLGVGLWWKSRVGRPSDGTAPDLAGESAASGASVSPPLSGPDGVSDGEPDGESGEEPDGEPDSGNRNRWVRIEPPPDGRNVMLGLTEKIVKRQPKALGWRPERKVWAPGMPFAIQQHEVTWGEFEPWLEAHPDMVVYRPKWLPDDAEARADLPVSGLPWSTARAYCQSLGARLPREAEWEYAARGVDLRAYAWGDERLDRVRTRAYAGPDGELAPVMSSEQDRTPGPLGSALYDMVGNAKEWTVELWRNDEPDGDESWVQQGDATYRAVRGLPPDAEAPDALPLVGAAYRDALCATAGCIDDFEHLLAPVGVRCVRDVRDDTRDSGAEERS